MGPIVAQVEIPQWQILSGFFLVGLIFIVGLIVLGVFARYFRLYIQSFMSRAGIGIWDLVGMTFRKVRPEVIVQAKIMAVQAGLVEEQGISTRALEAHYLAGGNVLIVEPSERSSTLGCWRASSSPSSAEISNDSPNGRRASHCASGRRLNAHSLLPPHGRSTRLSRLGFRRRDASSAASARSPSSNRSAKVALTGCTSHVPREDAAVCHGRLCQNVTEYRAASGQAAYPRGQFR